MSRVNPDIASKARRRPGPASTILKFAVLCALLPCGFPAPVVAAPNRGAPAPPINLADLDGVKVNTAGLAPRPLLIVFGELANENVRAACAASLDVLQDPRLAPADIVPLLVISQNAPAPELKAEAAKGRFPALVLHDPKREAFGAYHVLVLPTVVVVDSKGIVASALPGLLPRFRDNLTHALLLATGQESAEQFERALDPKAEEAPPETLRADRLVRLGGELCRHGLLEIAETRYAEALSIAPGHIGAKIGLAEVMLKTERLAEAEALFRSVLSADPDSLDAALGIAAVRLQSGPDGIAEAETSLRSILEKHPRSPRAHLLLGQVYERRGDSPRAAREFKTAAELLLDR